MANPYGPTTNSGGSQFENAIKGKSVQNENDWESIWSAVKQYKPSVKFTNFRGNVKAISTSYSGCIGTDEDGKPLLQPVDGLCKPNEYTNETPCKIENIHSPDTCKLNAGMMDAQKNFERLNTGGNTSKYIKGLNFTVFVGSMRDRYDSFFSSNPQKLASGVSTDFNNLGAETHRFIVENAGAGHSYVPNSKKPDPLGWTGFTIEWTGFFKPPKAGVYRFSMESDDSSILWIDDGANNPITVGTHNVHVDNRGGHGMRKISDPPYQAYDTNYHPIRIRYEEGYGGYGFIFKILDSTGKDIANTSLFSANPDMFTYYSLIRNINNLNLYDCYITGSNYNIQKSQGRKYLYRQLISFSSYNGVSFGPNCYLAVGDDGTLQMYSATKDIDFDKKEPRNENHKEYLCSLNDDATWPKAKYIDGKKFRQDISYRFQGDGNFIATYNGSGVFLSWQNWLGLDGGSELYQKLVIKKESYTDKTTGIVYGPLQTSAFTIHPNESTSTYSAQNLLRRRNIIVHKNNPFNKTGMNYAMISDGGNFKLRLTEQGALTMIYAIPGCLSVKNNGEDVNYTQGDQGSLAFYQVNADPKMNHTFLYDSVQKTLDYVDTNKYSKMYVYNSSPDYTEYKDIYIPANFKTSNVFGNYSQGTLSKSECKSTCDLNANCGYFYHSNINGSNNCYIDKSSGSNKYQFTPSSDISGSMPDFISKNPSSLFVKEKTVKVSQNLATNNDINQVIVDYSDPDYANATTAYDSYTFGNKYGDITQGVVIDPDLKKVRESELQYYGYSPSAIEENPLPSGQESSVPIQQPFISGGSRIEGFKEGADGDQTGEPSDTLMRESTGEEYAEDSGSNLSTTLSLMSEDLPSEDDINTSGYNTQVPTDGSTKSVNLSKLMNMKQPKPVSIPQKATPHYGFFETATRQLQNVLVHFPLYGLERWKDKLGKDVIGCKNRGIYMKQIGETNYDEKGFEKGTDGKKVTFKIVNTQADSPDPLYNAIYQATDINAVTKTDAKLPFSDNYLWLTQQKGQWFQIKETIKYPAQYICFSFYFKVSKTCTTYSRIFDFSNGPGYGNIISFLFNTGNYDKSKGGNGVSLGFVCFGENVYGGTVGWNNGSYDGYQNRANQTENYTFFTNVEDKWQYCEWYMQRIPVNNPSPKTLDGKPIPKTEEKGIQIVWWLVLHTLEPDNTITKQYFLLIDSTFSNYRDKKDEINNPLRKKYLGSGWNGSPWRKSPDNYISRAIAYTGKEHIPQKGQLVSIDQTRDYVDGYDCICIGLAQTEGYGGWVGCDNNLRPLFNDNKTRNPPYFTFTTSPFRLSFPVVPTTQNYIGSSPWAINYGCWWDYLQGSVRDFKIIVNQGKNRIAGIPGSFNWCVDNMEYEWWAARGRFNNGGGCDRGHFEAFQQFCWDLMPNDNNTGFFSNLAYKAVIDNTGTTPGFKSPNGNFTNKYDPLLTNTFANFIYSRIIYNDPDSRKMLKTYLQNMAEYDPNPPRKQGFSNIEGFSLSSNSQSRIEGLIEGIESTQPEDLKMTNMKRDASRLNVNTINYEKKLQSVSRNTKDLQRYINKKLDYQRDVTNVYNDGKTDFYDFSGNLLYYDQREIPSLRDTKISDNQEFIIQQNTVYIIGTITCATMIIAAIILGRQ